MMQLVSNT